MNIPLSKNSRIFNVDFSNLQFGQIFSDHMFVCDYVNGEWSNERIIPYSDIKVSPSSRVFHYGQAIFEGMKAYKDNNDGIWLFRPDENFKRFNISSKRLAIPEIPKNIFFDGLNELLKIDKEWIKKVSRSSVYKNFVEQKIAPGEKASSEIGNMYTASIFMSFLSMLSYHLKNQKSIDGNNVAFISYGSGSKAKIFEGNIEKDWIKKTKLIKLFENLDSRKKVSIDVYENLHKRKISSNINNNDGIIKLSKISKDEFTEGLRNYIKY